MSCEELNPGNTANVNFTGVEVDDVALTGATCTVNVYEGDITWVDGVISGTLVGNGGPITGAELEAGSYQAVIPSNAALDLSKTYHVVGTIYKLGVGTATWTEKRVAKARKGGA